MATAFDIVKLHGFVVESDRTMKPATDSIAVYADGDEWTHFARFIDGVWLSKLGEGNDIEHSSTEALDGSLYGKVVKVLSRRD